MGNESPEFVEKTPERLARRFHGGVPDLYHGKSYDALESGYRQEEEDLSHEESSVYYDEGSDRDPADYAPSNFVRQNVTDSGDFNEGFYDIFEPEGFDGNDGVSGADVEPVRAKANSFFISAAILLAVALLGVSGYFGWDWYQSRARPQSQDVRYYDQDQTSLSEQQHAGFIASQAVEPIFEALKSGDGDFLVQSWPDGQNLTEHERALMSTDRYKGVEQRISNYKIRDQVEYIDDDTGRVIVEVTQNEVKKNVPLILKKVSLNYGFYPLWDVVDAPLASAVSVVVDREISEVLVNSVRIPLAMAGGKATASVKMLPGNYKITIPDDVPVRLMVAGYSGGDVASVTRVYEPKAGLEFLKELGSKPATDEVKIEMLPSQYVKEQIQIQVDSYLNQCAEMRSPDNQGCPFSYLDPGVSGNFVRSFSYEILEPPVVGELQLLPDPERRYVDVAGSFTWGRVASLRPGRVKGMWERNIGSTRRPLWQQRDSVQSFSVDFDVILNGSKVTLAVHR